MAPNDWPSITLPQLPSMPAGAPNIQVPQLPPASAFKLPNMTGPSPTGYDNSQASQAFLSALNNIKSMQDTSLPTKPLDLQTAENQLTANRPQFRTINSPVDTSGMDAAINKDFTPQQQPNNQAGLPLWRKVLNQVDKPGAAVRNLFNDVVQANPRKGVLGGIEDLVMSNPFLQSLGGGSIINTLDPQAGQTYSRLHPLQDIKQAFTNDPGSATGNSILNNLGWKTPSTAPLWQRIAHGVAGFGADVAMDPLTWLTGGGSAVGKVGIKAATEGAAKVAAEHAAGGLAFDVAKGKNVYGIAKGTAENAAKAVVDKNAQALKDGLADPQLVTQAAKQAHDNVFSTVMNHVKGAQAQADKGLIHLNVPFSKETASLVPRFGMFNKTEKGIGIPGATALDRLMSAKGVTTRAAQDQLAKDLYGASSLDKLTPQEFDHLNQMLTQVTGKNNAYPWEDWFNPVTGKMEKGNPTELGQLSHHFTDTYNPMNPTLPRAVGKPSHFTETGTGGGLPKTIQQATHDIKLAAGQAPFVAGAGGKTAIGHALEGMASWFNPRTFGSANPLVNRGANAIADSAQNVRGNMFQQSLDMKKLKSMGAESLTSAEQDALHYMMENKFPKGYTLDPATKTKLEPIAAYLTSRYQDMAKREGLANTVDKYAPHVMTMSDEAKKAIADWFAKPENQKFMGKSAANRFHQSRKGFDSFAQLQDAVNTLRSSGDPEALQQAAQLENLFERNPAKAFQVRSEKSIRSTAMKTMYSSLEKNGLLTQDPSLMLREGYKTVTGNEAKKLGLDEKGSYYMHPDVHAGLSKVNQLFANDKLNKVMNNFNSVMNMWKVLPVMANPAHIKTRAVGNFLNSTLAGVKPTDYNDALDLYNKAKGGINDLTPAERDLWQKALDNGIVSSHTGQMADLYDPSASKSAWIQNKEQKFYNMPGVKHMGHALNWMDNQSRLATFMRGMKAYGDPAKAAAMVKKYMFNYNELTPADRAIRTVAPFWTWIRNNLPLMLSEMASQPRAFQAFNRAQSQDQGNRPVNDYASDFFHIPGTSDLFFNSRAPMQDLDMLSGNRFMHDALGFVNPFIQAPFEQQANKDIFTGMPIDKRAAVMGDPAGLQAMLGFLGQQAGAGLPANIARDSTNGKSPLLNTLNTLIGGFSEQNPTSIAKEQQWRSKQEKVLQKKIAQGKA